MRPDVNWTIEISNVEGTKRYTGSDFVEPNVPINEIVKRFDELFKVISNAVAVNLAKCHLHP